MKKFNLNNDCTMTIEELKAEKKRLENEANKLYSKSRDIADTIKAMTAEEPKRYFGKYVKLEDHGYFRYVHILRATQDYADWNLEGPGFTTYEYDNSNGRYFSEELKHNFISINEIEEERRLTVTFLTKEEFFADRKKYLEEMMSCDY